jgi:hypothetical protein
MDFRSPLRAISRLTLAVAALALGAAVLSAQGQPPVPLDISIRDIFGAALAGARVDIVHTRTAVEANAVTDLDGRALVWVVPGMYRIAVSREGYGPLVSSRFCVVAGQPAHFSAALGPEQGRAPRPPAPADPAPLTGPPALSPPPVSSAPVPPSQVLNAAEISEAMAFGRKARKLSAYPLAAGRALGRSEKLGHLFTPFLRVATMAQVADATKKRFPETEIPAWLVEREAWVVATAQEHVERTEDEVQRYDVAPNEIVIEPGGDRDPAKAIKRTWQVRLTTPCDAEAFESILGRQFPIPGLVAAFPMGSLQPGHQIAVTYSTFAALPGRMRGVRIAPMTRRVRISEEHVRNWK